MRKRQFDSRLTLDKSRREALVNPKLQRMIDAVSRRGLLVAVTSAGLVHPRSVYAASPERATAGNKRRPLYQARSDEVQTYYRVNRYLAK